MSGSGSRRTQSWASCTLTWRSSTGSSKCWNSCATRARSVHHHWFLQFFKYITVIFTFCCLRFLLLRKKLVFISNFSAKKEVQNSENSFSFVSSWIFHIIYYFLIALFIKNFKMFVFLKNFLYKILSGGGGWLRGEETICYAISSLCHLWHFHNLFFSNSIPPPLKNGTQNPSFPC